MDYQARKF